MKYQAGKYYHLNGSENSVIVSQTRSSDTNIKGEVYYTFRGSCKVDDMVDLRVRLGENVAVLHDELEAERHIEFVEANTLR